MEQKAISIYMNKPMHSYKQPRINKRYIHILYFIIDIVQNFVSSIIFVSYRYHHKVI